MLHRLYRNIAKYLGWFGPGYSISEPFWTPIVSLYQLMFLQLCVDSDDNS